MPCSQQSENLLSACNKSCEYDFHFQPCPFWTVQFCVCIYIYIYISASFLFVVCCSFFLEKNMLSFFLRYLQQRCGRYICVQLLQTLNILFENIRNETSLCEKTLIFVSAVAVQWPKSKTHKSWQGNLFFAWDSTKVLQTLNILFENMHNETSLCEKPLYMSLL